MMLLVRFTTPTEHFELRAQLAGIGNDGVLVVCLVGKDYEVATRQGNQWLVDTNWMNPEQNCNKLKRFDALCISVAQ